MVKTIKPSKNTKIWRAGNLQERMKMQCGETDKFSKTNKAERGART